MTYGYVTPTGGFTIECWFNSSSVAYDEALFGQYTQNRSVNWAPNTPNLNGRQMLLYLSNGTMTLDIRNETGWSVMSWVDSGGGSSDGNWHFVAVRLGEDGRTVTIWIDKEKKTTSVLAEKPDWKPGALTFGAGYAPHLGMWGDFYFDGGLAYCAAWDKPISDERIAEHYAAGSGGSVFSGDDEVTRLKRLYALATVPPDAQRFESAVSALQGVQITGQDPLALIMDTAASAGGIVFADGQGAMVYQNRRHRYNREPLLILTEHNGSAPNVGMAFSTDDTKVYNDVRVSRPSGGSARLRNRASEYEYGQKAYELKISVASDSEMRNAGSWIAHRYGEDRVRISGVTLSAESSDDIQELVESIEIGDCIAFDDLPDIAPETYMEFFVEAIGIRADFRANTFELDLELSPADLWRVFQVGVSTLGDGSRIAY